VQQPPEASEPLTMYLYTHTLLGLRGAPRVFSSLVSVNT